MTGFCHQFLGKLKTSQGDYLYYSLPELQAKGLTDLGRLPYSIRILLESVVRQCDQRRANLQDLMKLCAWQPHSPRRASIPFRPARILMQDYTGVPAMVDLAAMRSALQRLGGDPRKINPVVPVDLVTDHSVRVDFFASQDALRRNVEIEIGRNRERYEFLRWAQDSFDNFRVIPPSSGIVHQVNLERLAQVVVAAKGDGYCLAFPDTVLGTDSHTTMANGLGILGWGVGGIQAQAVMLGRALEMLVPEVVGVRLTGSLPEVVTSADLTLIIVQRLREKGVVGKFVEFYGPGVSTISLPERAAIANMAPEYGAALGYFPVDEITLEYLRLTGRFEGLIERVERYCKEQELFRADSRPDPHYSEVLDVDLGSVEPSLAGPKRPQDRVPLREARRSFQISLTAPEAMGGFSVSPENLKSSAAMGTNGGGVEMRHGAVVIAAITSCTHTSNPSLMIAAGLLAKNALDSGLQVKPYVKTILAPGSRLVASYLGQANSLEPLASLGFNLVGYGCTTCIGNSGPLSGEVVKAITSGHLVTAAVYSGNRNFEGRVHPYVNASYLASPPMVVAYALAGRVDIDFEREPLGTGKDGEPVYLRDLWPRSSDIDRITKTSLRPQVFETEYVRIYAGDEGWNALRHTVGEIYPWNPDSTYLQEPPYFSGIELDPPHKGDIIAARVLALFGDYVTTSHISPPSAIPADGPAGKYLIQCDVRPRDFNSYGSRRGNHEIMVRGIFSNMHLKNRLVPGLQGGYTLYMSSGDMTWPVMSIYDAAMQYRQAGVALIIVAGRDYGIGSDQDWAAKGLTLLGVRAVIAESFEHAQRANLVGMGILPLQFNEGDRFESLGLTGKEVFSIEGLRDDMAPNCSVTVRATQQDGRETVFQVLSRLDTQAEVDCYRHGGILPAVLRKMLKRGRSPGVLHQPYSSNQIPLR